MSQGGLITLLPPVTITAAVANVVGPTVPVNGLRDLLVEAAFVYGSGGTTAKAWVQTRVKGGTWRDVMNFAFLIASLTKFQKVSIVTALAANIAASDAALADNTILDGFLGDELRIKYTTTGTYAGSTTLALIGSGKY